MAESLFKSGCDWATERGIRINDISKWNQSKDMSYERPVQHCDYHYCIEPITEEEFNMNIEETGYTYGTPYKPDWFLELRMYTLVPYNIMGIQKGIQHEHSVTDYVKNFILKSDVKDVLFDRWANEWKTTIILNGGTSNEGHNVRHGFRDIWYVGTMQKHLNTLVNNGIKVSTFYEPDLNSMLTGISFIVDERVFNKRLYPDVDFEIMDPDEIAEWTESIGGEKNAFLRDFLKDFKLA